MKILHLILSIFLFAQGKAQYNESIFQRNKIVVDSIVITDTTLKAEQLFSNANEWRIKYFQNTDRVLLKDENLNKILFAGSYPTKWANGLMTLRGRISFQMEIICKDGKYKYQINDLAYQDYNINYQPISIEMLNRANNKSTVKSKGYVVEGLNAMLNDLYDKMTSKNEW